MKRRTAGGDAVVASHGGWLFGCMLRNPDFRKLAGAYGIASARADSLESFHAALIDGITSKKLNLVELNVELCDP